MMRTVRRAAYLVLAVSTLSCNEKGPDFFLPGATSPQTGNLTGVVSSGTVPIAGATVSLSQSGSTTTNASGVYSFLDLSVGTYTITTTAAGFTCATRTVTVLLNQTVTSNITCTPLPGSVTGTVRVSGNGQAGVAVTLMQGTTTVGSATTAANGTYTITNVAPGAYSASVTPPANTTCTPNPQNVTVVTNQAATANFDCTPIPGSVTGVVRVSGVGQSGIVVTLSQGATTAGTATTGADGTYTIANVAPGTYSASITAPANTSCTSNPQNVTVTANAPSTADFDCTPLAGSVAGTVKVDTFLRPGVLVTLSAGGSTVGTGITNATGAYTITNVPPGAYTATVTPPSGTTCTPSSQSVTVQANQVSTVDFQCTSLPAAFTVGLTTSYRRFNSGSSTETCVLISTTPSRVGAAWSTTWTGPGVLGTNTRSGTTDLAGQAVDRQPIDGQNGTYTVMATVVSSGITATATATIVVTAGAGTCAAP